MTLGRGRRLGLRAALLSLGAAVGGSSLSSGAFAQQANPWTMPSSSAPAPPAPPRPAPPRPPGQGQAPYGQQQHHQQRQGQQRYHQPQQGQQQPGQQPYSQPQHGQQPYPQPQHGQQPYPQPHYGQQPYPQPHYGQQPQPHYGQQPQPYYGPGYAQPTAPGQATPGAGPGDVDPSEAEKKERSVAFDIAAGTIVPLGIGPQLTLEIPGRVLLQLDLAWMPRAYGSVIAGFAGSQAEGESMAQRLIEETLADSLVVRASGGWRPFPKAGFEIYAGYTGLKVSGALTPEAVGAIIGGSMGKRAERELTGDVEIAGMLHNFHVALGWRWVAYEHLVIRALLGYTQTVSSSTTLAIPGQPELQAEVEPRLDEGVDEVVTRDLKMPLVGLNLGYRF